MLVTVPSLRVVVFMDATRNVLLGLAVILVISVVAPHADAMPAPATPQGGPDTSAQRYRWVDSTAPGCKAPSLIGSGIPAVGSAAAPAKGCPLGWDEVSISWCPGCSRIYMGSCCTTGMGWYAADDYYTPYYIGSYFPFTYYGTTHGGGFCCPVSSYVEVNANGFIRFPSTATYSGEGNPSRTPQQMPTAGSETGGVNSAPENMIAAYWTNLYEGLGYYTNSLCPGDPYDQGVYFGVYGSAPNRYMVFEWKDVRVSTGAYSGSPGSAATAFCGLPHKFATFEIKLYETTGNIDVIYPDNSKCSAYAPSSQPGCVDNNGQQVSLGIDNSGGTIGLNYDYDTAASLGDRSIRYYMSHNAMAQPKSLSLNEDCYFTANWPATPCAAPGTPLATALTTVGSDPDYGDTVTFSIVTPPAHGVLTSTVPSTTPATCSSTSCNPATCDQGTCTYSPYPNFNGPDPFTYRTASSDGSTSAPATVTMTVFAINDRPAAQSLSYDVGANEFIYATPPVGVLATVQDAEYAPLRNTFGTSPPSAGSMTEGGVTETFKAWRTSSCSNFGGPGWNPTKGTVNFFNNDGSFQYTPNPGIGASSSLPGGVLDTFQYCVADYNSGSGALLSYGFTSTVTIHIGVWPGTFVAHADALTIGEDGALTATGPIAPAANDVTAGCSSGLQYQLLAGSGPFNQVAGSFVWNAAAGSFTYTPQANWSGIDGFWYSLFCGATGTSSNTVSVRITVSPLNDQPTWTSWSTGGDNILEDGGVSGPMTPPPYFRSVPNFISGISPGGGADELTQQLRIVIVSQTNTGMFNSNVLCPTDYDFSVITCPTPVPGPYFLLSGPAGAQTATMYYTTKPDANGVDTVCWLLADNGGTLNGGVDKNPNPPLAPNCFNIIISAVPDAPRATTDVYTIYKNHELYAPAAATTFPVAMPAVNTLMAGAFPDYDPDGQPIKAYLGAAPYVKIWYVSDDGSFHYTPKANYVGLDYFKYYVKDSDNMVSAMAVVTVNIQNNNPPTAAFAASATSATQGDTLAFSSACKDADTIPGNPASDHVVMWLWDFGDGFTSTDTSPTHQFLAAGIYTVTLTCYDTRGDFGQASVQVTVGYPVGGLVANQADQYDTGPVAYAGENQNVPEGALVHLHGVATGGFAGASYVYAWTQISGPNIVLQQATTADPVFEAPTYQGAGPQAVVLQIVASDGSAGSVPSLVQITVHSTNHAPVADAGKDQRVLQGTTATLDGSGSSDADNDALQFEWTQLGGVHVCLEAPIGGCDAQPARTSMRNPSFTVPTYDGVPLTFQLVASDGQARTSALVTILATPPDTAAAGFTYDVTRTASGSHVVFHPNVSGSAYVWDFGDGQGSSAEASPSYDYQHAGTYTVKMSVIDGSGGAQAFVKPLTVSAVDHSRVPASQVTKHSPGAGLLELVVLAGCALVALRRRP